MSGPCALATRPRAALVFDLTLAAATATFVAGFLWAGSGGEYPIMPDILRIRAFGICAFLLLSATVAIAPAARLFPALAPLRERRSHLAAATALTGGVHAYFVLNWYHDIGRIDAVVALLADNTRFASLTGFPYELLGVAALLLLLVPATTGHEFWPALFGRRRWRRAAVFTYAGAYGLGVGHIALGAAQSEPSPVYAVLLVGGLAGLAALQIAAARRERADPAGVGSILAATRWAGVAIAATLLGSVGMSLLTAAAQRDPGPGHWGDVGEVAVRGRLEENPYPFILVADRSDGRAGRTVLLVAEGKFGAQPAARRLGGQFVEARGYPIYLGSLTVLQLSPGESLAPAPQSTPATFDPPQSLGRHRLRGEIVDAKCFTGAMKPGNGKAHKDCAILCLLGGIPPLFLTRAGDGSETVYLIGDPDGGPVGDGIRAYAGEPVEIDAEIARLGDLNLARVDPKTLRPLAP